MKIALARRGFSHTGGAESYVKRLGRALVESGHEPILYAGDTWPQAEWPYGKLIRIDAASPQRFARAIEASRSNDEILYSLERVLACDCYRAGDGVHKIWLERRVAHEPAWRSVFRFINRKHSEILNLEGSMFRRGGARHVIANSQMVRDEIVRTFDYPEEKISVVYNGLPESDFKRKPHSRAELRRQRGFRERDLAILFAGSGWDRKGLRYAIEAVHSIRDPDTFLLVAGKGEKSGYRFASSKVRWLGPVADLPSLLDASDLFLLPTIYDPFSNACLEALSHGLPVITTRSNGFAEIVEPGTHGSVVEHAQDVAALRRSIEEWAELDRRAAARFRCMDLARRYTMKSNVDQTLHILEKLRGT